MIEETPQPEPETVALDDYVPVLEAWYAANQKKKELDVEIAKYKALLGKVMGTATVGTVDGVKAVDYEPIENFNGTAFSRQYPDTHRFYHRDVTKKVFDKEWLKADRPDLWEQFQSRPMKNAYVPRDKAQ